MNSRMFKLASRSFSDELKTEIVRRLQAGESAETLAQQLCVIPEVLEGWRTDYESPRSAPTVGYTRLKVKNAYLAATSDAQRVETLKRVVGRQALEIDFLKRIILRVKEIPGGYGHNWRVRVLDVIRKEEELAKPLLLSCGRAEIGWPTD